MVTIIIKDFLLQLFRERRKERERKRGERNCVEICTNL